MIWRLSFARSIEVLCSRLECEARPEDFLKQTDGEGSRADGRIADFHLVQQFAMRFAATKDPAWCLVSPFH